MFPCAIPGCAAMAERKGGECAAHGAGYRKHDGSRDVRCAHCRRLIMQDHWYRRMGDEVRHLTACKIHPEVKKEQDKQKEKVTP